MSFGEDEEILQDFLLEAGEILDQLSEQLVDLERSPEDRNLLNAIFRGFHTVKGGAGFLQLNAMVDCCHVTENLFDILRNGKRAVTSELMDIVLQALDVVNLQFQEVSNRQPLTPPSPELLRQLNRLVSCDDLREAESSASAQPPPANNSDNSDNSDNSGRSDSSKGGDLDLSDDEFEGLLDALEETTPGSRPPPAAREPDEASAGDADEITESEFEALLDQLHGPGRGPSIQPTESPSPPPSPTQDPDLITDGEFEALLDELHGAGKGPSQGASPEPPAQESSASHAGSPSQDAGLITDQEFEALLDELHGRGKGPSQGTSSSTAGTQSQSSPASSPPSPSTSTPDPVNVKPPSKSAVQAASAPEVADPKPSPTAQAKPSILGKGPIESGAPVDKSGAPADKKNNGEPKAPERTNTADSTVRVETQRLDEIMNMVGELVLVRNRLVRLGLDSTDEALNKAVANLDVVTGDLQTTVMQTRMQPIRKVFGRFPRVVRDLARTLKKEIILEMVGEDTDLDKNLVEALADPLVHLVRNSVDHGIELPDRREAAGKPRMGKIVLSAEQEGDHILLAIQDDGAGMDPDQLRQKAVEKGLMEQDAAMRLPNAEAFNLIFAPGFSTKVDVSDVSGRGVGMDVVKTKISQLNGSIEIQSKMGEGTRIAIKVPLTLAIMPTLMVTLAHQCFALPLVNVNEIFHMDLSKTHVVDGQECVTIRNKAVPIFHLKRWLVAPNADGQQTLGAHVVIINVATRTVGFVVDQLVGQEEVVIKPLGKMLQGTPGMAGATITGDGTIALILDVPGLLKRYVGRI